MSRNLERVRTNTGNAARRQIAILIAAAIAFFTLIKLHNSLPPITVDTVHQSLPVIPLPSFTVTYPTKPFNETKVAFLVENRPLPMLAPLILHFMGVIAPDWRFRFMGSPASVESVQSSRAIQHQVDSGKLDLTYIPRNMTTGGQEQISTFLTNLWLYETVLQPAEWLLVFQTDSILCANSEGNLDDWLDYDWVGAPWSSGSRYGGNGGLSLRRVSSIIQILRDQIRLPNSDPEDVWLTSRLGHRPGAKVANGSLSLTFSGENIYYEKPMGYHTGGSGRNLGSGLWGTPELRQHIYDYCELSASFRREWVGMKDEVTDQAGPEVKLTLEMDAKQYVPGECNQNW
ncbi:MAG: hypothetical protein LQ349_001574 [Xanthoria aureola]|nr:MAG: hypothetical protein LQ349_001574 [Xanthoria aureola]